VKEHLFML
jgi:hypothetical protein